jgi:hypothetical protein
MGDPKLTKTRVVIYYEADDGFECETQYSQENCIKAIPAEKPFIDAMEELARLTALFGFEDQAREVFDGARNRVAEWRKNRKAS